jgi:hypothetical protein
VRTLTLKTNPGHSAERLVSTRPPDAFSSGLQMRARSNISCRVTPTILLLIIWTVTSISLSTSVLSAIGKPFSGTTAINGSSITNAHLPDTTLSFNDKARILNTPYDTLTGAFDAALNGDTIKARVTGFVEDLHLNSGVAITMQGGYTANYTSRTGYTTLDGILEIAVGELVVDRLVLGPASTAPVINTQPASRTVTEGETATFSVVAEDSSPLSYQWMKNGAAVSGAVASSYITSASTISDNGARFSVEVSNGAETSTSSEALLTVYPAAGNPDGHCPVPPEAAPEDVSTPDRVVGTGTPESCTAEAFIAAVAQGGTIVFDCGQQPVTITLDRPAKVFNDANQKVVIDGGGLVTLSGGGVTRILYMNTCDPNQHWTTDHCQNQESPRLTVQNLTFIDGNSRNETVYDGGGAVWVRGGRFKVVNCRFMNNTCAPLGPDTGGASIRVFSQYQGLPVYVVNSTFGGADGFGNYGSNGGGISSIGVNWTVINSLFSYNRAAGNGGNPAQSGTPGGGSGGAIYNDGNTMTLSLCGTLLEHNSVNAYGSAIFFVSNNHDGTLRITDSVIRNNTGGAWYLLPGISAHSDTVLEINNSSIH